MTTAQPMRSCPIAGKVALEGLGGCGEGNSQEATASPNRFWGEVTTLHGHASSGGLLALPRRVGARLHLPLTWELYPLENGGSWE